MPPLTGLFAGAGPAGHSPPCPPAWYPIAAHAGAATWPPYYLYYLTTTSVTLSIFIYTPYTTYIQ